MLVLIFVILWAAAVQGMPAGNQTWTEEPWDASAQESQAAAASTLSNPIAFNISGNEPATIRLGDSRINYSDYVAAQEAGELWVRDGGAWSRYKQATVGEEVDLIVRMPEYGKADIYLISYANSSIKHWNMNFQKGYSLLKLTAAQSGRQFVILAAKNVPSNALIIDVSPSAGSGAKFAGGRNGSRAGKIQSDHRIRENKGIRCLRGWCLLQQ